MKRQLFLHHYFPALYFAILTVGVVFEIFTHKLSRPSRMILAGGFLAIVFIVYLDFSPLAYGESYDDIWHHCERIKWGNHWDWTCLKSPEDKHELPAQIGGRLLHAIEHIKDAFPNHSGSISASAAKTTGTATGFAGQPLQAHKGPAVVPKFRTTSGGPAVIEPNLALPLRGGLRIDTPLPADVPERVGDIAGDAEDDDDGGDDEPPAIKYEGEDDNGELIRPPHESLKSADKNTPDEPTGPSQDAKAAVAGAAGPSKPLGTGSPTGAGAVAVTTTARVGYNNTSADEAPAVGPKLPPVAPADAADSGNLPPKLGDGEASPVSSNSSQREIVVSA
ncbi:hypothetical protein HDU84_007796 [Entophlyctis sp. JEL0112]|nr:hypothetical protein HDU84_007796 [Entophlyctis sp. JEL0112]